MPPSKLLMNVTEDIDRIHALFDKVYNFFGEEYYAQGRHGTSVATGAAVKAATQVVEENGGRVMFFTSTLGAAQGCGRVQNRYNATVFNTDQEATKMLAPEQSFFRELALDCTSKCIAVDLFVSLNLKHKSLDLASIAPLAGISGGDLYFYADFDCYKHGEQLYFQIFRNLTRVTASDIMCKVRVSTGLTVTDYFGQFNNY